MAFWSKWFARQRDEPSTIPTGRITAIDYYGTLSPFRSRTTDILKTLRQIPEEAEAIHFLRKVTPDVSMAVWNFLRLANQGHTMHFYDVNDRQRRLPRAEDRWREFAERVNQISNSGMDGLIDQLHASAFLRGAMGLEAEVNSSRTDIVDLYPVIPQTIVWKLEDRNGRKKWIPYQQQIKGEVSLEPGKANFFWVPVDPDIEDPRGNLIMAPVLWAIDFQLQILQDLQAVLHHQGWPRNDVTIIYERVMQRMPPDVKANPRKAREWLWDEWKTIVDKLRSLEPDKDYVHFDDVQIQMKGGDTARSLDVRAVAELVDVQVLNGTKQMGIVTNRVGGLGQTESWGSITFKIFCDGIKSIQRGSKRLMEEVARLWLRVHGMQGIPVFEHNVVDWQSEEQKWNVKLLQEQFWAVAKLMNWVDNDTAAQNVVGTEKATESEPSETIRVSLSVGGNQSVTQQLSSELQPNREGKVLQLRQRDARS